MSTTKAVSLADPKATPGADLTAEAVQAALQSKSVSACKDFRYTITLFQRFGRAQISWSIDPGCVVGSSDVVQLREEGSDFKLWNFPVKALSGEVDTGHSFGSGLTASYWAWDFGPRNYWKELLVTAVTD